MNSLTNAENLKKLSEREIELGTAGTKNSWHNIYKDSAWIFVGGLPFDLTEGDVICIFSQYGEIVNINMVRDKKTGKTKGYAFICYEDQRSTILAVDNFNTTKILQRTIRVDHVKDYRPPDQDDKNVDDVTKIVRAEGVAPRPLTPSASEDDDFLLPAEAKDKKKKKKEKKSKKDKKNKKEKIKAEMIDESNIKREPTIATNKQEIEHSRKSKEGTRDARGDTRNELGKGHREVKVERLDPGYSKYERDDTRKDRLRDTSEYRRDRRSSPTSRSRQSPPRTHSSGHSRGQVASNRKSSPQRRRRNTSRSRSRSRSRERRRRSRSRSPNYRR